VKREVPKQGRKKQEKTPKKGEERGRKGRGGEGSNKRRFGLEPNTENSIRVQ